MSYGTDNLERTDLKINLKSLYIICKKLLSISYQHNAAPVCRHHKKFLTVFGDISSQSELLSGFLNSVPQQSKDDPINIFNPQRTNISKLLPNHCFLPIISPCHLLIRHIPMAIAKIISMTKDSGNQGTFLVFLLNTI